MRKLTRLGGRICMQPIRGHFASLLFLIAAMVVSSAALAEYDIVVVDYPGAEVTQLFGIDNTGKVIGTAVMGDGSTVPFTYDYRKAIFTTLAPVAGAVDTLANGINEPGIVVGEAVLSNDPADFRGVGFIRYKKGIDTLFEYPGADETQPRAVNNAGLVSGIAFYYDLGFLVGFIYDPTSDTFTEVLPSPRTFANGINNRGYLVGNLELADDEAYQGSPAGRYGFILKANGDATYFRVDDSSTNARGISDSGIIVGFFGPVNAAQGFVAEVRAGAGYVPVTIPPAGLLNVPDATATYPQAVSNGGDIAGLWNDADGYTHGFIAVKR